MLAVVTAMGASGIFAMATPEANVPTWSDEFDGLANSRPGDWWTTAIGNAEHDGWGNKELQYYTANTANLSLDGQGHLAIQARVTEHGQHAPCWNGERCPWTSGRMSTEGRVEFRFGWAEARIKVPAGAGLWAAFWMLGTGDGTWPANGEIDVMEWVGGQPRNAHGTAHGPRYAQDAGITAAFEAASSFANDFHLFAVDKQPGAITWYVDNHAFFQVTRDSLPAGAEWVFDRPFYLILNLAVGGEWPGTPDASTRFPATMLVDYVRLYGDVTVR